MRPSARAEAIAVAKCTRAAQGDVNAAKEVSERTEGRVTAAVNEEGKIDYAAGRSAGCLLNKASSGFKRKKRYYEDHDQGKKHKRVMLFSAARFENFVSG